MIDARVRRRLVKRIAQNLTEVAACHEWARAAAAEGDYRLTAWWTSRLTSYAAEANRSAISLLDGERSP